MERFKLRSSYSPTGDQPQAIKKLVAGFNANISKQILLGVTGSGKTFTAANVITDLNRPTLVISHNKTLAAQLFNEFKDFFPENAVHYFVSYYDYYQPEAYIPRTDTYIEKDSDINEEIDRLRNAATSALLTRKDVLIVASVSCIYGLGNPEDYGQLKIDFQIGAEKSPEKALRQLVDIQYERNDQNFERGKFRIRGDILDIFPSYEEKAIRVQFFDTKVESIKEIDPLTGEVKRKLNRTVIFPAKHFVTPKERIKGALELIREELAVRVKQLRNEGKLLEAQRLTQRTNFDIEMIEETGYCSGIENYSRYLSGRQAGDRPSTLLDYFPDDFSLIIDESHMTIPQIRGMYNGDRARKETLVDYGFRLPSALDNRPLRFSEFEKMTDRTIYVSATPGTYEFEKCSDRKIYSAKEYFKEAALGKEMPYVTEQVIRPTGLLDPKVEVRKAEFQIDDLISEIKNNVKNHQRTLVTTLTKKMAEDLSEYLKELDIKVNYLHSEVTTLERPEILRDLRAGIYDVIVGVNLLREGLDLPEVSLVAIIDADKEGFLRSEQALIQTIGRVARHSEGRVIMYADHMTESMRSAISETERRRKIQEKYNKDHGIIPKTITKALHNRMVEKEEKKAEKEFDLENIPPDEIDRLISELRKKMDRAAASLEFEQAAGIRDDIRRIREKVDVMKEKKRKELDR